MNRKIVKSFIALSIVMAGCFAQNHDFRFQEGDLLFQQSDCGAFCEAINKVTEGVNEIDFNHVGIVIENTEGGLEVLEAVSSGVKTTDIDEFLKRSKDSNGKPKVAVGRLKNFSEIGNVNFPAQKHTFLGKKYDKVFDVENDSYYCSELVYFLFVDTHGKPIFHLEPMTFKDPETGETFDIWQTYYDEMDIPVPEGEPGLNPGGISRSEKLEIFFPFSDFR